MAIAILTRGKQAGRRLTVVHWPATIGRDPSSIIQLDDGKVSRFHARIKKRDRLFIIEDLQSKNGTYLNGDRVSNAVINSGDKVLIGDTEIVFLTPESQVDISTEIADLEHFATLADVDDVGGPIDIPNLNPGDPAVVANRIESDLEISSDILTSEVLSHIFEIQSNILTSDNLKELCANTLKGLHTLSPEVSRSALFLWSSSSKRLLPLAARHTGASTQFLSNRRAFESVISRKQGLILSPDLSSGTSVSRHRVLLPIMHLGEVLCVVHLEADNIAITREQLALEQMRFFLERCAPSIDAFVLRQELENYSVGMIEAMVATLEAKDTYTHGHSERVSRYALAIADEMNLDRDVKRLLLMSSLCHDIGKIGVPDAILRKAALLNPDEYEEMKQHPVIGANIVAHLPNAKRFISGIKYHHEKWDGSGYPEGLVGENIPFFGRIVAVSDVFDAMISGRSYSGFIDESDAVQKLSEEKELFDPDVVSAFTRAWQGGRLTQKTSTQKNSQKKTPDEG